MTKSKSAGKFCVRLAVIAACAPTLAFALPVIPGASGFGVDTPAGRGGAVIRVTNLNASGSGSLRDCVTASGPRVCVFEIAGTITLTEELEISSPYVTVAGQTAPSPGITLRGAGLLISASNVLVQHIKVRVGDAQEGPPPDNRDALKVEAPVARTISNVVVDHCSFSWAEDENASIWEGANNVSFLNDIFSEPLNYSLHTADNGTPEAHGYGVIIGPSSGNVGNISLVGNLMADQLGRNPLAYADFVMVNNLVYNYGQTAVEVGNLDGRTTRSAIVGNVFLKGVNSTAMSPVFVRGNSDRATVLDGSKIYISDLSTGSAALGDPWSASYLEFPVSVSVKAGAAPIWPTGLVAMPTANNAVYNSVLSRAGARPGDRDAIDARIVSQVKNRQGAAINCVTADGSDRCSLNGGGWPAQSGRTRALTLPANPNQVNSDGYTNLDKWLQAMAAEVEGAATAEVPSPPSNTQLL